MQWRHVQFSSALVAGALDDASLEPTGISAAAEDPKVAAAAESEALRARPTVVVRFGWPESIVAGKFARAVVRYELHVEDVAVAARPRKSELPRVACHGFNALQQTQDCSDYDLQRKSTEQPVHCAQLNIGCVAIA